MLIRELSVHTYLVECKQCTITFTQMNLVINATDAWKIFMSQEMLLFAIKEIFFFNWPFIINWLFSLYVNSKGKFKLNILWPNTEIITCLNISSNIHPKPTYIFLPYLVRKVAWSTIHIIFFVESLHIWFTITSINKIKSIFFLCQKNPLLWVLRVIYPHKLCILHSPEEEKNRNGSVICWYSMYAYM